MQTVLKVKRLRGGILNSHRDNSYLNTQISFPALRLYLFCFSTSN